MVIKACLFHRNMTFHECFLAFFDRPNFRAEWTGIPGAGGAYAAAVPRVTVTLEPMVRALVQFWFFPPALVSALHSGDRFRAASAALGF